MANRAVTLYLRIKTADGKKPFCKPVYLAKGRLKPLYAFVDGEPEHRPEGVYYMRFGADSGKQPMVPLGTDPYLALDKVAEKERWLRDRERGVVTPTSDNPKQESRKTFDSAVEQYFTNLDSQGKDRKTIRAYRVALKEFRQSCSKQFLDEIGKQDLLDYMGWLRIQPPKLRKDGKPRKARRSGDPNRTYFNKVNDVVIFLSAQGIHRLLKKCEYPKFAEKPVVFYDSAQVGSPYSVLRAAVELSTPIRASTLGSFGMSVSRSVSAQILTMPSPPRVTAFSAATFCRRRCPHHAKLCGSVTTH
jgi:hypothetical protein